VFCKNSTGILIRSSLKVRRGEVSIPLHHAKIPVPENLCQDVEIDSIHDCMTGEGMAESVERDALQAGRMRSLPHGVDKLH